MPSVTLHNLGCNKNQIDGERILHYFRASGYEVTPDYSKADVIVVNTCAFIREAQEEAIESILQAAAYKDTGRCRKLVLSGCFSERYRNEVRKKFPEVDLWVGVHDWETLLKNELRPASVSPFARVLSAPIATQHIKIAEGCSHGCTYCAIPLIRGKFRSRPANDIVIEAQWLESQGVRELILVAQDSSFYGRDLGSDLVSLLENLLTATTFPWIRLMYLHPRYVGKELLRLFASEQRLCPYFDMPLQHIADPILRAMNRSPLSADIRNIIGSIRNDVPGAALRSTFICGFPGETDAHFKTLLDFIEETRFDKLGVFPYSPEQGTKAFALRRRPRTSTVNRRCEEIMTLQREISREILTSKTGTVQEVIIDSSSDDPAYPLVGRTRLDAPEVDGRVFIAPAGLKPGSFVSVRITKAGDYDLFGEIS